MAKNPHCFFIYSFDPLNTLNSNGTLIMPIPDGWLYKPIPYTQADIQISSTTSLLSRESEKELTENNEAHRGKGVA